MRFLYNNCERFGSYEKDFHECYICDVADECEYYKNFVLPNLNEHEFVDFSLELADECEEDYYLNNDLMMGNEFLDLNDI